MFSLSILFSLLFIQSLNAIASAWPLVKANGIPEYYSYTRSGNYISFRKIATRRNFAKMASYALECTVKSNGDCDCSVTFRPVYGGAGGGGKCTRRLAAKSIKKSGKFCSVYVDLSNASDPTCIHLRANAK